MVNEALHFVSVTVGGRLDARHAVAFIERKISVADDLMEFRNGTVSSAKVDMEIALEKIDRIRQIQNPMRTDKRLLDSRGVKHYIMGQI